MFTYESRGGDMRNSRAVCLINRFCRRRTYTRTGIICSSRGNAGRPRGRRRRNAAIAASTWTNPRSLTGMIPRRQYEHTQSTGFPIRRANLDFDSIILIFLW